jgi:hypothetical protein
MRIKTISTRLTVLLGAGGLVVACGDNIKVGGDDDVIPDADPTRPDVMPPTDPGIGGTIAVTDVSVTTPEAAAVGGIRGGAISIAFSDLDTAGGEAIFGTTAIGGCLITRYDPTHRPHPQLDAGPITVSGDGLLKTVGPCTLQAALGGYVCISANAADQTITALNLPTPPAPPGAFTYTLTEQVLTGQSLAGSYLSVNGFPTPEYNSGASAFPVVGHTTGTNVLTVVNLAGEAADLTTETTEAATIRILNGFQPVPGAGAAADFLGDETGTVTISKAANAVWPAIDFTVYSRGEGFDLDNASAQPHAFPTDAAAQMVFSCAGAGGDCGGEADATLEAMILSGRATRKSLAALAPFQMPTEDPATDTWLEWQCAYILSQTATMPEAAVQAIQDFDPTRVEMRVLRVAGTIVNDEGGENETRILVGHGLVGHTTFPPAAN